MNTTTPRKLIVTKGLKRKWLAFAALRWVANRKQDKNASLTHCRDVYWKKYPHFYRRIGKMIRYLPGSPRLNRPRTYDEFAEYMDLLSEQDLQNAMTEITKQLNPVVVTPPPPPPDPDPKHGTNVHRMGGSSGGGGSTVSTTLIEPDPRPPGFSAVHQWESNTVHQVNTDHQHQLQAKLRQALMAVSQSRVVRGQNDGDLDMDRLTDIGAGINMSGLFMRTVRARRLSVAVQIYADISDSMGDKAKDENGKELLIRHADLQLRLCIMLGYVLERMRVPTQIIAYDNDHYLVKDWNRNLANAMVWKMPIVAGCTDLPTALSHGFTQLATRREDRRLAVIISDGDIGADASLPRVTLHDSETNETWSGYPPTVLELRKRFPRIETCFFGIGKMKVPDGAFDYKRTQLSANIVEQVSNDVVNVIVKR